MGKRIERNVDWMDDVAVLLAINIRKGSEHTVEYVNKAGQACAVRVPASFISFLEMVTKPGKAKLAKVA